MQPCWDQVKVLGIIKALAMCRRGASAKKFAQLEFSLDHSGLSAGCVLQYRKERWGQRQRVCESSTWKALWSIIMGSSGKGEPDLKSFSILASWLDTRLWKLASALCAPSALPSCAP